MTGLVLCQTCDGTGRLYIQSKWHVCGPCGGTGTRIPVDPRGREIIPANSSSFEKVAFKVSYPLARLRGKYDGHQLTNSGHSTGAKSRRHRPDNAALSIEQVRCKSLRLIIASEKAEVGGGTVTSRILAVRAVKYRARAGASYRAESLQIPEPAKGNDSGYGRDYPAFEAHAPWNNLLSGRRRARKGPPSPMQGRRWPAMRARLADFCALTKPDVVAFEAPILGGIQTMNIVRLLIGLAAIVEQFCHERGIEIIEKDVSTVRKHFCGNGRAKKHDVMQRCTMLQWPYSDNNQADAHALWSLVAAEIDPRHAHRSSLIFAGARV